MSENAVKLFALFREETPDYDPNHIEVYVQWLADKIDDLTDELEGVEGIKQTALNTIRLAREAADLRVSAIQTELTQARAEIASLRGGWVKCADRLPELGDGEKYTSTYVIARDENGCVYQDAYCVVYGPYTGTWCNCRGANIIEWRPLA